MNAVQIRTALDNELVALEQRAAQLVEMGDAVSSRTTAEVESSIATVKDEIAKHAKANKKELDEYDAAVKKAEAEKAKAEKEAEKAAKAAADDSKS